MIFEIHNDKYNDYVIVEGESVEELREIVKHETSKRGWKDKDCWSKEIEVD